MSEKKVKLTIEVTEDLVKRLAGAIPNGHSSALESAMIKLRWAAKESLPQDKTLAKVKKELALPWHRGSLPDGLEIYDHCGNFVAECSVDAIPTTLAAPKALELLHKAYTDAEKCNTTQLVLEVTEVEKLLREAGWL